MASGLKMGKSVWRLARPNSGLLYSISIPLVLLAAQAGGFFDVTRIKNLAVTIAGIGFIIFVHELGHFLVAKACGVKCEKFYLGFDVYGIKLLKFQWGETEYGIGAVPLGGYVKMLGQDDNVGNAEAEAERTKIRNEDGTVTLDPRSYPAKSVPQRMAIISAGVIMNLIFAVIFASIAFTQGVEYQPCVIGKISGGGAAWKAGLKPGDRILQFSRQGKPSKQLRFESDLMEYVILHAPNQDLDLLVEKPDGSQSWVTTRPQNLFDRKTIFGDEFRPRLGVGPIESLNLIPISKEAKAKLPESAKWAAEIHSGDKIIAANGQPVKDRTDLTRLEIESADQPLKLTIERTQDENDKPLASPQTVEIVVPPVRRLSTGVVFRAGGISTVLPDSIASKAGIQPGDVLTKINGEAIIDPVELPYRFSKLAEKETTLTLQRGDKKEEVEIKLTPGPTTQDFAISPGAELAIDAIGVSFPIENVVSHLSEKLSDQKVDLALGDVVTALRQELTDEKGKPDLGKWLELRKDQHDGQWISSAADAENLTALHLRIERNGETKEVRLIPTRCEDYALSRAFPLKPLLEIRKTSSPTEALSLGLRETKESGQRVLKFLSKLVTGGVSPTKLGGPLSIFYVANQEAAVSLPRFLLFLTLISANLAIVNFLPIPVLDGGHMMFLAAEAIRGKPVSEDLQIKLSIMGLFFVMGLMLFVISLDVLRFSGVSV